MMHSQCKEMYRISVSFPSGEIASVLEAQVGCVCFASVPL